VLLTKSDLISNEATRQKISQMRKINPDVFSVSIHDWEGLQKIIERLTSSK